MTALLQQLSWQTLEARRRLARLVLFYELVNGEAAIAIPPYIQRTSVQTRQHHTDKFMMVRAATDTYKYSFIPRTIADWNKLPPEVIQAPSVDCFRAALYRQL